METSLENGQGVVRANGVHDAGAAHLRDIADAIESEPERFNMDRWVPLDGMNNDRGGPCGTASCIGGWSQALRGVSTREGPLRAYAAMGLDEVAGRQLCIRRGLDVANGMPKHLRAKGMADALRQIADGVPVLDALGDVAARYV